ncbi:hypothetical protein DPMN_161948 [Dreissena polymorpha]|uniref:Uncharacterized protein n=1 Tax=Dreissena polymorpha TaxID=45954 RepID=A0A9D4EQP1_DREPO|nr:hypothetical protein DPMN_161948 [Dreissena polymorpha]
MTHDNARTESLNSVLHDDIIRTTFEDIAAEEQCKYNYYDIDYDASGGDDDDDDDDDDYDDANISTMIAAMKVITLIVLLALVAMATAQYFSRGFRRGGFPGFYNDGFGFDNGFGIDNRFNGFGKSFAQNDRLSATICQIITMLASVKLVLVLVLLALFTTAMASPMRYGRYRYGYPGYYGNNNGWNYGNDNGVRAPLVQLCRSRCSCKGKSDTGPALQIPLFLQGLERQWYSSEDPVVPAGVRATLVQLCRSRCFFRGWSHTGPALQIPLFLQGLERYWSSSADPVVPAGSDTGPALQIPLFLQELERHWSSSADPVVPARVRSSLVQLCRSRCSCRALQIPLFLQGLERHWSSSADPVGLERHWSSSADPVVPAGVRATLVQLCRPSCSYRGKSDTGPALQIPLLLQGLERHWSSSADPVVPTGARATLVQLCRSRCSCKG